MATIGRMDGNDRRRRVGLLVGLAIGSVALWQTAMGSMVLYPFTILSTWFHEMGHGLAALVTGSRFDHLVIFADGSGYARLLTPSDGGRIASAVVSASGPMGPAIAGALMIVSSRTQAATRLALEILGWALVVSTAIWVRSLVGWIVLPGLGLTIIALERFGSPSLQRFLVQLLGVQACISVWRQFDYLFSAGGYVGGQAARSDTAAIADVLLLPYWVWGSVISAAIVALLWWSMASAFRRR